MIIDCHVHLPRAGRESTQRHRDRIGEELVQSAVESGIGRIVVSCLGRCRYIPLPSADEVRQANDDAERLMRRFPDIVRALCYLNPRNTNWKEELSRRLDSGMAGVKLWIAAPASSFCVLPVAEDVCRRKSILLQHSFLKSTGNYENETTPFDVAALAEKLPELTVILAHAGGNQEAGLQAVRKFPNVRADTSGCPPQ